MLAAVGCWQLLVPAAAGAGGRAVAEPGSWAAAEPGSWVGAEPGSWVAAEPGSWVAAEPGSWACAEPGGRPAAIDVRLVLATAGRPVPLTRCRRHQGHALSIAHAGTRYLMITAAVTRPAKHANP